MRNYEITFLTREDGKDSLIKENLESLGGAVFAVSSLGQKNLTYKIKKEARAYVTTVNFELAPDKLEELNRKLLLEDEILRHLVVSVKPVASLEEAVKEVETEKKIKEEIKEEVKEEKAEEKKEEETEAKEIKEEVKQEKAPGKIEKEEKEVKKSKPAAKKKAEKPAIEATEEERLEALDKKLEELLKE